MVVIDVTFSKAVNVTGVPTLTLNSGGTATYTSGSGTSTLVFTYNIGAGDTTSRARLDASSASALSGTITDTVANNPNTANLTVPVGTATTGALANNKNILIAVASVSSASVSWGTAGTSGPLVTQGDGLRLLPAGRSTDMPWLGINKISITLSVAAPLAAGDVTVTGITVANYGPVSISGSGTTYTITLAQAINLADRVTITIGNAGIATYTRRLDVLPGDFNDDGAVNAVDVLDVNKLIGTVGNIFADIDGSGTITITDVQDVRDGLVRIYHQFEHPSRSR